MNSFDEAVERKLAEQRSSSMAARSEAQRHAAAREEAADLIASELRQLAVYLGTKMGPRRVELRASGPFGLMKKRSPSGFVWRDDNLSFRQVEILLPSGAVWTYLDGSGFDGREEILNLSAKMRSGGFVLFRYGFGIEHDGALRVRPEYFREDVPPPAVPIQEAMANIAASFLSKDR